MSRVKDEFNKRCRDDWLFLIGQWVHNERDRAMLIRHFLDGIVFEDLAEEFELSVNYCQERVSKACAQLFKHVKS